MGKAKQKGSKSAITGVSICVFFGIMGIAVLPTTLILLVGLVPAAVAFFADTSRERSLGMTVLMLNGAGILPLLLKLWKHGHTNQQALDILIDPFMLIFFLIPSGCGWLLYHFMPFLVVGIVRRKAEARIKTLEKFQADLVEQWGVAVAGVTEMPKPDAATPVATPEANQANAATKS